MRITNKWIKFTDSKTLSHVYIPKLGLHWDNHEDISTPMKDKLKKKISMISFHYNYLVQKFQICSPRVKISLDS